MITHIKHFLHLSYLYVVTRIIYIFKRPPKVMNSMKSIKYIIDNNLSVCRYGDGEFNIINGSSIKFQDFDANLQKRLEKILFSQDNFIAVCIPAVYTYKITRKLKYNEEIFWLEQIKDYKNIYLNKKYKNKTYCDSCITRPYIRYKDTSISLEIFQNLKKLWDGKNVMIVEGKYSRLGVNNDLFDNSKSIKRILCPNKNAFSKYEKIYNTVKKNHNDEIVLIALGPTATVLAYDLASIGIKAIDLGHLDLEYEWFRENAKEKKAVKNKIVNEVMEQDKLEEINDKKYIDSIIEEI